MRIIIVILLALSCISCKSVGRALQHDFERKVGEITEGKVEEIIDKRLGQIFTEHLPEGIMALLIGGLGLKLREQKKQNGGKS